MVRRHSTRDFRTGIRLSANDMIHEWKLSACLVFAIAGVIAPLLLLFGLKYGTFTALRIKLVQDPKNRAIIPLSTVDFRKKWLKELASRKDVGFFVPRTREIASIVHVRLAEQIAIDKPSIPDLDSRPKLDILPTAPGDILLVENGAKIPGERECVLTRLAAEKIGASKGDKIECTIDRKRSSNYETVSFLLDVINVIPDRAGALEAIFVTLPLVDAVETYRDGGTVERYGWVGDDKRADSKVDYVSFRLYARTIDDVDPLRRYLAGHGIETLTKAYEIERVKTVDRGLTKIFWLVAIVGIFGCIATLAASFASSVERKKKALGVLRLMGISRWLIFQFPVAQAIIIGFLGFAAATAAFFTIAEVINQLFGAELPIGSGMCVLAPKHFAIAFLCTIAIVLVSSVFSAWQATRIDPADAIRDE